MKLGKLRIDGWAGRRVHCVEIVGQTAKSYICRCDNEVHLPGGRYVPPGVEFKVPAWAVVVSD